MKTEWTKGLKGEEAENFRSEVLQAQNVLDKLAEIVYNRLKEVRTVRSSDYNSPSWSHLQAHKNGQGEAFEEIISLLKL